jgi:hypothetical protein
LAFLTVLKSIFTQKASLPAPTYFDNCKFRDQTLVAGMNLSMITNKKYNLNKRFVFYLATNLQRSGLLVIMAEIGGFGAFVSGRGRPCVLKAKLCGVPVHAYSA